MLQAKSNGSEAQDECDDSSLSPLIHDAGGVSSFYGLIGDLVRSAWFRYVRRHNHDVLGTTADLAEFLLSNERLKLSVLRSILEDDGLDSFILEDRAAQR